MCFRKGLGIVGISVSWSAAAALGCVNPASNPSPAQINLRASSAFPNFKHKSKSDSFNPPSAPEWLTFIMEPLNGQWPSSQGRFTSPYNSLMWTYAPPGPLVQLSGQNEHVQNSLTLSKFHTQWLLAHFNLIYLVKDNANAKLSCTSKSCAGSCLPEPLLAEAALSCQNWWLCCAGVCVTLGSRLGTKWSRSLSDVGFGASLSSTRCSYLGLGNIDYKTFRCPCVKPRFRALSIWAEE